MTVRAKDCAAVVRRVDRLAERLEFLARVSELPLEAVQLVEGEPGASYRTGRGYGRQDVTKEGHALV